MAKNTVNEIIRKALALKPQERYMIVECLMKSLEEVDEKLKKFGLKSQLEN